MEGSKGGGGGGGEVRRVNVIYFLSRNGRVEHPHLIRVRHLHRSGVRLRDVKKWLSELRGKDMPECFAWSYKRRYKTGYVWQDLTDDDLITPIADNEYVLKGSELACPPSSAAATAIKHNPFRSFDSTIYAGEKAVKAEGKDKDEEATAAAEIVEIEPDNDGVSPMPPPWLDADSDESTRRTAVLAIDVSGQREKRRQEEARRRSKAPTAAESRRASHVLMNILTCGVVETDDAALLPIARCREQEASATGVGRTHSDIPNKSRKGWRSGGKGSRKAGENCAAPHCSQCGKAFNPEKMYFHMKKCKGLRRGRSMHLERMPLRMEYRSEEFSTEGASAFLG